MKLYVLVDTAANEPFYSYLSNDDGAGIRDFIPQIAKYKPVQDIKILHVGFVEAHEKELQVSLLPIDGFKEISLSSYKFSEIQAEEISKTDVIRKIEQFKKARELELLTLENEIKAARQKQKEFESQ